MLGRRMRRLFLVGLLVLSLLAVQPTPTVACSCASNVVPPMDIVFVGRTVTVVDGEWIRQRLRLRDQGVGGSTVALITVELMWQSPQRPFFLVVGGTGEGDCALPFVPGAKYLIYGLDVDYGPLSTNICFGSSQMDDAVA